MEVLDLEIKNALLNIINHELDIDKICLYAKYPHEAKHQLLINERRKSRHKVFKWFKRLYWILKSDGWYLEEHNPNKKWKISIVFDDMIADMLSNKKFNPIVSELFIRERNLNIAFVFMRQSYFAVPKNI